MILGTATSMIPSRADQPKQEEKAMEMNGDEYNALQTTTSMAEAEAERAIEEVRAALVISRKFPREMPVVTTRIHQECHRIGLAEVAIYTYPRGSTKVEGPSIRLAEALARSFGNILYGIQEMSQRPGESEVKAFAWDLETNTRAERVFKVKHIRETKKGNKPLTSPRDIYEMVANQGARRLRACILELIPGDIVESALRICRRTLTDGAESPLSDRINGMAAAFSTEFGVSVEQIEIRMGHNLSSTTENELVTLKGIYRSLKEGMGHVSDHFDDDTISMPQSDSDVDPSTGEVVPPLKSDAELMGGK